eukprot:scaffold9409_cov116-Isochrysis_galbana.AAC.11
MRSVCLQLLPVTVLEVFAHRGPQHLEDVQAVALAGLLQDRMHRVRLQPHPVPARRRGCVGRRCSGSRPKRGASPPTPSPRPFSPHGRHPGNRTHTNGRCTAVAPESMVPASRSALASPLARAWLTAMGRWEALASRAAPVALLAALQMRRFPLHSRSLHCEAERAIKLQGGEYHRAFRSHRFVHCTLAGRLTVPSAPPLVILKVVLARYPIADVAATRAAAASRVTRTVNAPLPRTGAHRAPFARGRPNFLEPYCCRCWTRWRTRHEVSVACLKGTARFHAHIHLPLLVNRVIADHRAISHLVDRRRVREGPMSAVRALDDIESRDDQDIQLALAARATGFAPHAPFCGPLRPWGVCPDHGFAHEVYHRLVDEVLVALLGRNAGGAQLVLEHRVQSNLLAFGFIQRVLLFLLRVRIAVFAFALCTLLLGPRDNCALCLGFDRHPDTSQLFGHEDFPHSTVHTLSLGAQAEVSRLVLRLAQLARILLPLLPLRPPRFLF